MSKQKCIDAEFANYCRQLMEIQSESQSEYTPIDQLSSLDKMCKVDHEDIQSSIKQQEQLAYSEEEIQLQQQNKRVKKNFYRKRRQKLNTTQEENYESTKLEILVSSEPCNCSKTACQKMYCECLARGKMCSDLCNCISCLNHEPNELLMKSIKAINSGQHNSGKKVRQRFRSQRYRDGCTCRKSHCLKKYCECYANNRGCTKSCMCEDCENLVSLENEDYSEGDDFILLQSSKRETSIVNKVKRFINPVVKKFQVNQENEGESQQPQISIKFQFVLGGLIENAINCRIMNDRINQIDDL